MLLRCKDIHDLRVLSSVGPAGDVVCTDAGDEIRVDENLKFWRIREVGASQGTKEIIGGDELGGGRDFKYPLARS